MSENATAALLDGRPIPRLILQLGIPAMFGQFFNILYSIVDRIFVGQIPGAGGLALAGIGICAPALTAVTAFAYLVGIGGASAMSMSLGRRDAARAQQILANAFLLLVTIALTLTLVLLLCRQSLLYLLGASDALYPYAARYFTIYICGTLASLLGVGLNQFLLAQGFARDGMIAVVIGALVNVALDPLFIFVCGLGVSGAALATVLAQCAMAAFVLWRLCSSRVPVRLSLAPLQAAIVRQIVGIGGMSFLITLMDNLIIVLLNIVLRRYGGDGGDALITCATVVQSFLTIVFCPAQGITSGCGTLFSYHYGASHYAKIRQAFLGVFLLCGAYIGLLQIAVQCFPDAFARLFLADSALAAQAAESLRLYTFGLLGVAVQYALVDSLTAMGKIRYALPLSVFRKIVYVLCILVLPHCASIEQIFWAGTISDVIGASFSALCFFLLILPKLRTEMTRPQ